MQNILYTIFNQPKQTVRTIFKLCSFYLRTSSIKLQSENILLSFGGISLLEKFVLDRSAAHNHLLLKPHANTETQTKEATNITFCIQKQKKERGIRELRAFCENGLEPNKNSSSKMYLQLFSEYPISFQHSAHFAALSNN